MLGYNVEVSRDDLASGTTNETLVCILNEPRKAASPFDSVAGVAGFPTEEYMSLDLYEPCLQPDKRFLSEAMRHGLFKFYLLNYFIRSLFFLSFSSFTIFSYVA